MYSHQVVTDYTTNVVENAHVKVFVRARPSEDTELFELDDVGGRKRKITMSSHRDDWGGVGSQAFLFDGIFWCDSQQSEIFDNVCKDQVDHVLRGYNACCFAYGQTGSGKTHSMFYPRGGEDREPQEMGIIPRAIDYLFSQLAMLSTTAELHVSFLEIYCDTIRDLGKASLSTLKTPKTTDIYQEAALARAETFGLRNSVSNGDLLSSEEPPAVINEEIREDAQGNVFVKGVARLPVTSSAEAMEIIERGLSLRATEATSMNDTSSRSHTVFTIEVHVKSTQEEDDGDFVAGKLHLVDLAGSERLKKSESSGIRLKEALHINKSLTALGKVIVALDPAERKKQAHVPYRDSKLTRLLSNALGGDSYTTLLATIRPSTTYAEECLSTLQFANRCRRVANNPRVHRIPAPNKDAVQDDVYRDRLKKLQLELAKVKDEKQQLAFRLAAATGDDENLVGGLLESGDIADDDLLPSSSSGAAAGKVTDPAQLQGAVTSAVLAALEAAGVKCSVDDKTGGVRVGSQLIAATLPAAFSGHTKEGRARQARARASLRRRTDVGTHVTATAARVAHIFGWSPAAMPMALIDVIAEREAVLEKTKTKLQDSQNFTTTLESDVAELRKALEQAKWDVQRSQVQKDREIHRVERQEMQLRTAALGDKDRELTAVLATRPTKAPIVTTTIIENNDTKDLERKLGAAQRSAKVAEGRFSDAQRTITALKDQYQHWLDEKDQDAMKFVDQVNRYRTKKRRQLTAARSELRSLWATLSRYVTIVHRIKAGKYPMKSQRGIPMPLIPDLPRCRDMTLENFPATKRALQDQEEPDDDDDIREVSPAEAEAEALCVALRDDLDRARTSLTEYETEFEAKVQSRVNAELQDHHTVQYIRDLEGRYHDAQQTASKQTKAHAQLRVAYLSQLRQHRPASAAVVGRPN